MKSRRSFLRLMSVGGAGAVVTTRSAFAKKKPGKVEAPPTSAALLNPAP